MATRSVQFTGERTGRREMIVPRYGLVRVGDVIDVPEETAESWTSALPTGDGMAADFAYAVAVPSTEEADPPPAPGDEAETPDDPADKHPADAEHEGETR